MLYIKYITFCDTFSLKNDMTNHSGKMETIKTMIAGLWGNNAHDFERTPVNSKGSVVNYIRGVKVEPLSRRGIEGRNEC